MGREGKIGTYSFNLAIGGQILGREGLGRRILSQLGLC